MRRNEYRMFRLGCSVKNLVDLVDELHKQDIQFKSLIDAIDIGAQPGRSFFHRPFDAEQGY